MLTSFFGKSNPVNFLLLGFFISLGFIIHVIKSEVWIFSPAFIAENLLCLLISIFSMLLVDFIIRKNALTRSNTFGIFFFSSFLLMFPAIFFELNILVANTFVLLAFRRILSLRTEKNPEKKIFDASLWITMAVLFNFYCLLYFVILLLAVVRRKHTTYKHMLIPVVGFFGVCIMIVAFRYLIYDAFNWPFDLKTAIRWRFFSI